MIYPQPHMNQFYSVPEQVGLVCEYVPQSLKCLQHKLALLCRRMWIGYPPTINGMVPK